MDLTGIGAATSAISDIVGKIWPDKTQVEKDQMAQQMVIIQGQLAQDQGQIGIDNTEAANKSMFVSGWRPFVGWVCGSACAWNWIGISIANFILGFTHYHITLVSADITQMLPVLMGMLGMGALRTYEKTQGVASK